MAVEITLDQLMAFRSLFSGNDTFYGCTELLGTSRKDGKQEVNCYTKTAPLLRDNYEQHLLGKVGLGVCPVKSDGTVSFGAIDVDCYDGTVLALAEKITALQLPLCPCLSKSGGLHLFAFFGPRTTAKAAVEILTRVRSLLGLPAKTEIFPKQTTLSGKGNWINLPYFDVEHGNRCLLLQGARVRTLSQALDRFTRSVLSIKEWEAALDALPLSDAPPCLQSLYCAPDTTNRNTYLFNLATYYKAKGENWQEAVLAANDRLSSPLTEREIQATIFNSHNQGSYAYQCGQAPLCDRCDKKVCVKRDYGISSKDLPDIDYGQMFMVESYPPRYYWNINGQTFNFANAGSLRKYAVFQEQCADQLGFFPHTMNQEKWIDILNLALRNVVKTRENAEELSSNYAMVTAIKDWLFGCVTNVPIPQAMFIGIPHLDLNSDTLTFGVSDLLRALSDKASFSSVGIVEWLKQHGATTAKEGVKPIWKVKAVRIASMLEWKTRLAEECARKPFMLTPELQQWLGKDLTEQTKKNVEDAAALRLSAATARLGRVLREEDDL